MRGVLKVAVAVGLLGLLASPALAQFRGGFGLGGLVRNESVQKELNVTDEQKTKLTEALDKVRENHKDDLEKFRDLSMEERQKLMRTINEENTKAVRGILDDKQMKRLKQITWQTQGAQAFQDPEVQKSLKLTDEQKDKIKAINEDSGKQMRELFQGGFNEETRKKMQDLRKETLDKCSAVLTADQKKSWQEMTGKPFEVRFERRQNN
jgi:Spy/CpxP family protein refolding chaperone